VFIQNSKLIWKAFSIGFISWTCPFKHSRCKLTPFFHIRRILFVCSFPCIISLEIGCKITCLLFKKKHQVKMWYLLEKNVVFAHEQPAHMWGHAVRICGEGLGKRCADLSRLHTHTQSGESPGGGGGGFWASLQKSFRRLFAKLLSLNSFMDEDFLLAFCDNSNQSYAKLISCEYGALFCKAYQRFIFLKLYLWNLDSRVWAREGYKICPYTHTNVNCVQCFKCCKTNDKTYLQF
jgi:hypothetical protein